MAAKPTKRVSTSPEDTVYSGAAPLTGSKSIVPEEVDVAVVVAEMVVLVVYSDIVPEEVLVEIIVAETVAIVAFAEICGVAAIEESKAAASERADDAAAESADASEATTDVTWGICMGRMVGIPARVVEMDDSVQVSGMEVTVTATPSFRRVS